MDMFSTLNRQQQPFIQSGYGAMSRLNTLLGLSPRPRSPGMGAVAPGPWADAARGAMGMPGQGYMPTPGGGVQPIMQVGDQGDRRMYAGGPGGDPSMGGGGIPLQRILMLRAMHGDTQAGRILGMQ